MERGASQILFNKHYKSLCHFAWKLCGDISLAEDLVQDAFIAFFKNQELISKDEIAIKQFLYTSIKFAFLNLRRKEKVEQKYWFNLPFTELSNDSFELNIIHSEFIAEVHKIVSEMPSGCQTVFKMGYFEGLNNQEIAEKLDVSVNTVKTQKQRGLKLVMQKLHPEFLPIFIIFFNF